MKLFKFWQIFASLLLIISFQSCDKDDDVSPDTEVIIPNAVFKQILLDNSLININGDSIIQTSEAIAFTGIISATNTTVTDVTGIESFPNITRLALFGSEITSIDVSKNTKLTQLLLENNEITSIDISKNTVLTDMKAGGNKITKANVANGNNANMTRMELNGNSGLTCIQIDAGFTPPEKGGWRAADNSTFSTSCN
jgi:hypothetical protein